MNSKIIKAKIRKYPENKIEDIFSKKNYPV